MNYMDIHTLRSQHPVLRYKDFEYELKGTNLEVRWHFELEPDIVFTPQLTITHLPIERWLLLDDTVRENLFFHLGLAELPSYWKAACPPTIVIEAGFLNSRQINWWHDLFMRGLGEFFFTNEIDFTSKDFLNFEVNHQEQPASPYRESLQKRTLLPIGGGKDSSLSIELLKEVDTTFIPWALNPIPATRRVVDISETGPLLVASRQIDPSLLKLNQEGYLNGHTPFSAYLAFLTTTMSIILGISDIAVSNESSANECNTVFHDHEINHQYSKSEIFETTFRQYCAEYLSTESNYYSMLRPLNELQIGKLFSKHDQYFSAFRSCNRGQKEDIWCHECSKCLFSYTMLVPFVDSETLTSEIFSHDLYQDKALIETALDLTDPQRVKPLDCVGTYEESQAAFALAIQSYEAPLPPVLIAVESVLEKHVDDREQLIQDTLSHWDQQHHVPDILTRYLKQKI